MLPSLLLQVKSPSHCFHLHQGLLCQQLGLLAFMAWNPSPLTPSSQGLSTLALLLEPSAECPEREEQRLRNSRRGSGRVNTGQMLHSVFVQRPSLLKQRFPFGKHKTRCARAQELPLCSRTWSQVGEMSHCRASFFGEYSSLHLRFATLRWAAGCTDTPFTGPEAQCSHFPPVPRPVGSFLRTSGCYGC